MPADQQFQVSTMSAYWIEFVEILLPGLALKLMAVLPLVLGTIGAVRHLRVGRRRPYIRNLFGALAAGVVTLGLLWTSLFGDGLSTSSTAGLIFLFAPIYSAVALLMGYLIGVVINRASSHAHEERDGNLPIRSSERKLVWVPVLLLGIVVFGVIRYSVLNNDLSVAERASRPETMRYVFEKVLAGKADAFGVPLFLAQNPKAPADLLEKLGKSSEPQVRGFVATNPNTPVSVVAGLRDDCAEHVRKAARERLKDTSILDTSPQAPPQCGPTTRMN
jgi:hypothetical protein